MKRLHILSEGSLHELLYLKNDLWEIKSSKFMIKTQQSAMTRHEPCRAKRLQSQSEGTLQKLFLMGKDLWEI